jgi:hypothetical protein
MFDRHMLTFICAAGGTRRHEQAVAATCSDGDRRPHGAARWLTLACLTAAVFVGTGLVPLAPAHADGTGDPSAATATLQDLQDQQPAFTVRWLGRTASALPMRLRVLNQASPLAYSLDIRRQPSYGDAWTAISLGEPSNPESRSLPQVGVFNPLPSELIARGGAPPDQQPVPATGLLEQAARQVAIWSFTNGLPLTAAAVPNARLLSRAQQLAAMDNGAPPVPLQAADHGVQIFIRETTANTVRLAIILNVDPNTHPSTAQNIDLYLDGLRFPVRTQARTSIVYHDGAYHSQKPRSRGVHAPTEVAEVNLDRNTKVVDASAVWVGVRSDPGLVFVSGGAAPPVLTADESVLNFRTSTRLDPANYTSPRQLLDKAGTDLLARLPSAWVWIVLVVGLYLIPKAGREADAFFRLIKRLWRWGQPSPPLVRPYMVTVEAPTVHDAIQAGLTALGLTQASAVDVTTLESAKNRLFGRSRPAKVRLSVSPGSGNALPRHPGP